MQRLKAIYGLFRQTFSEWSEDKASRLAAALAYYALFSIAPLLVFVVLIVGLVYGPEAAQGQLNSQLTSVVGQGSAELISNMVAKAGERTTGSILTSLFGFAALILGASGFFAALEDSLNTIWEVTKKKGVGLVGTVRNQVVNRLTAFALVLFLGVLMLALLILSAMLNFFVEFFQGSIPGLPYLLFAVNIVLSLAVLTFLFAAIYKVLPDVEITWRDVWVGAAFTAVLFVVGKEVIGLYLARASVGSIYGAAASLVVLLIWIYYSAQILLFGAEFTQVYAKRYGSQLEPAAGAVPLTEGERAQQGAPHEATKQAAVDRHEGRQAPAFAPFAFLQARMASLLAGALFGWILASRLGPHEGDGPPR